MTLLLVALLASSAGLSRGFQNQGLPPQERGRAFSKFFSLEFVQCALNELQGPRLSSHWLTDDHDTGVAGKELVQLLDRRHETSLLLQTLPGGHSIELQLKRAASYLYGVRKMKDACGNAFEQSRVSPCQFCQILVEHRFQDDDFL